jgi:hypothetical protein
MKSSKLDTGDKVMARTVSFKIVQAMLQQGSRGTIKGRG